MSDMMDVPELRGDYLRRDVDGGCVVWSPVLSAPTVLDPVAAVMLEVIDGEASIGQLVKEVHEEVGVPLDIAHKQVERAVHLFDAARLLTSSDGSSPSGDENRLSELFSGPLSH